MNVQHDFPLDAQYEIRVVGGRMPFGATADQREPRLQVLVDGAPQELKDGKVRLKVTAGPHRLGAAVVDEERSAGVDDLFIGATPRGGVQSIIVFGPYESSGVGETPSRRAVFTCRPEAAADEERCARSIIGHLAARAFRLPGLDDNSVEGLMAFYRDGKARGGFETGVQQALARILVDPRFILRFDGARASPRAPAHRRLTWRWRRGFHSCSGAAFPTKPCSLLRRAVNCPGHAILKGRCGACLPTPARLHWSSSSENSGCSFGTLDSAQPEVRSFDDGLRQSLRQETRAFISSVMLEDRGVLTLLDANYTFLDERLAEHYGVPGIRGSYLRKVQLAPQDPRRGLLGQGSILTLTSVANRTSPVSRGVWVLENLLGATPPQPPANVNTNIDGQNFVTPEGPNAGAQAHGAVPAKFRMRFLPPDHGSTGPGPGKLRFGRTMAYAGGWFAN